MPSSYPAEIDHNHQIHLQLPKTVASGKAKVIVMYEEETTQQFKPITLGLFKGKIQISNDFDDPLQILVAKANCEAVTGFIHINYDPFIVHPLLMVYSAAKSNRAKTKKLTVLTLNATTSGFIVAYADQPKLPPTSNFEIGTIPGLIAKKWCVDEHRIFRAGYSDSGTAAWAWCLW